MRRPLKPLVLALLLLAPFGIAAAVVDPNEGTGFVFALGLVAGALAERLNR